MAVRCLVSLVIGLASKDKSQSNAELLIVYRALILHGSAARAEVKRAGVIAQILLATGDQVVMLLLSLFFQSEINAVDKRLRFVRAHIRAHLGCSFLLFFSAWR